MVENEPTFTLQIKASTFAEMYWDNNRFKLEDYIKIHIHCRDVCFGILIWKKVEPT